MIRSRTTIGRKTQTVGLLTGLVLVVTLGTTTAPAGAAAPPPPDSRSESTIDYRGDLLAYAGRSITLAAGVSPGACTGTVDYIIESSSWSASAGVYADLGTFDAALTTSVALPPDVVPDTYQIVALYSGSTDCKGSSVSAPVAVTDGATGTAAGGGTATTPDGSSSFGFVLSPAPAAPAPTAAIRTTAARSGSTTGGTFTWSVSGRWRFTGSIALGKVSGYHGAAAGSGSLEWFDGTSWIAATTATATVAIAFETTNRKPQGTGARPGAIGLSFSGTRATGVPALPSYPLADLASGTIVVA